MRVATVVGNRPQFVKAAAVSRALRERHEEILIHTGQHHDAELSAIFFEELAVPPPDHRLGVAGAGNSSQLARMLGKLASLLAGLQPDVTLVYGDTNSTLAGALAAADLGIPLVHVEAGMRSFDRGMPEERNRVLTDQLASLLLCSSEAAADQLRAEQAPGRAIVVGDVMVDVALATRERVAALAPALLAQMGLGERGYLLATAHRAGNVDDPGHLAALLALFEALAEPIVLPLHPRTRARLRAQGLLTRAERAARVVAPLGYLEFAALLGHARAILTDSGGVQKEAYLARVPCLTLREETEWTETVASGWNTLVGLDASAARAALARQPPTEHPQLYGDGHAAERVVAALEEYR